MDKSPQSMPPGLAAVAQVKQNGPNLGELGEGKVGAGCPAAERCRFDTIFMPRSRQFWGLSSLYWLYGGKS